MYRSLHLQVLDHKTRRCISIRTTCSLSTYLYCHRHQLHCTHCTAFYSLVLSFLSLPGYTFPSSLLQLVCSYLFRCLALSCLSHQVQLGYPNKESTSFRSCVYSTWMPSSYTHYQTTVPIHTLAFPPSFLSLPRVLLQADIYTPVGYVQIDSTTLLYGLPPQEPLEPLD